MMIAMLLIMLNAIQFAVIHKLYKSYNKLNDKIYKFNTEPTAWCTIMNKDLGYFEIAFHKAELEPEEVLQYLTDSGELGNLTPFTNN